MKKNLNKRLELKKVVLCKLNFNEMNNIKGGYEEELPPSQYSGMACDHCP